MKSIVFYKRRKGLNQFSFSEILLNNGLIILLCTLFLCGEILGSRLVCESIDTSNTCELLTEITGQSALQIMGKGLLNALVTVLLTVFCSACCFGIPMLMLCPFFTGGYYGYLCTQLISTYQMKGLGLFCLIILPGAMIRTVAGIYLWETGMITSKLLLDMVAKGSREDIKLRERMLTVLLPITAFFAASVIDFIMAKLFISLF